MTQTERLDELISSTVTIPTIPSTLAEIQKIVNDPDGSAAEAAEVIVKDPAIASKVLRLANSSIYALRVPVSDIQHAVCILGLKILKNLVVQATVLENFQGRGGEALSANWLWDHSLKTARAARGLAGLIPDDPGIELEEAYTAGLLHDIGKVLLMEAEGDSFLRAVTLSRLKKVPLYESEMDIFGFTHASVGSVLAERWNMSATLCTAIGKHHDADLDPKVDGAAFLLQFANTMAHSVSSNALCYHTDADIDEEKLASFGLDDSETFYALLSDVKNSGLDQL
ncbi:MAG: HDOD domain-containing protein [Planctomycetes bacterium]|nr:HDOD domain-containing protein [Planctomycetota bacterium]